MPFLPRENSLKKNKKPIKKYSSHESGRWSSTNETRYHTQRWKKSRLWFLKRNPACVSCRKRGIFTPATVVDHIIAVSTGEVDFWDKRNWQALCASCHNSKSSKEAKEKHKK